jgi:hypothetical protein
VSRRFEEPTSRINRCVMKVPPASLRKRKIPEIQESNEEKPETTPRARRETEESILRGIPACSAVLSLVHLFRNTVPETGIQAPHGYEEQLFAASFFPMLLSFRVNEVISAQTFQ